jgi:hypothetical protein
LTPTGAMISIMTYLSIVEASGVRFIWCCIWSGWGSLSTLIPSIQSLKEVRAWNHLPLWGDICLCTRFRHLLKTLSDRLEDRPNRRRIHIDAGPGVGALLGLTLLLMFA